MTRWLPLAVVLTLPALPAGMALAQEKPEKTVPEKPAPAPQPLPAMEPCGPTMERTINQLRLHLVEEQTAIVVPKLTLREEVRPQIVPDLEVRYRDEKRVVQVQVLKPREVEQLMTYMKLVLETTVDCTGKPCTIQRKVPAEKTVKVTVFDTEYVDREVIVRVPVLVPVEREVLVKRFVLDCTTEAAIRKQLHAETVPNEIKVPVPMPVQPPPCPAP